MKQNHPLAISDTAARSVDVLPALSGEVGPRDRPGRPPLYAMPIVAGVVGHRDLRSVDIPQLETAVRSVLLDLRQTYPHAPLAVLSPLAEGADRLVARVALELGARLVALLPLPQRFYETDFTSEQSLAEFRSLIARADEVIVLDTMPGHSLTSIAQHGAERDAHYAQAGAFVALNSQVLIALWNGEVKGVHGGTSDVVQFRLMGIPEPLGPPASPLDPSENGPLIQIVTPRQSTAEIVGEPFEIVYRYPEGYVDADHARSAFHHILERVDRYNEDVQRIGDRLSETRRRSAQYLCPDDVAGTLPRHLAEMRDRYAAADTMAIHFQRRTLSAVAGLFIFVFAAVMFFEVYSHLLPDRHWLLAGFLGVLLIAWGYNVAVKRGEYHTKYLDYRALAEGIRVQFFWSVAGMPDRVSDFYMRKQRTVLDWIRQGIRTWTMSPMEWTHSDPSAVEERLKVVQKLWVEDQARYFPHGAHALHKRLHRLERWVDLFFGGALAVAALQLIGYDFLHETLHLGHAPLIAIGVLLVCAGMLHGYIQKRALSELSKQYERMAAMFVNAAEHMEMLFEQGRSNEGTQLLRDLGVEALVENGDWLLLHRERPVEMPRGG